MFVVASGYGFWSRFLRHRRMHKHAYKGKCTQIGLDHKAKINICVTENMLEFI